MLKRMLDVFVSSVGLLALSPLIVAVAIWIKWDSPGPVFYRGKRGGRNGKPFSIFKFRSMVTDADRIGGPSTAEGDTRITRSGHFIRRYKLDELPQLICVLLGDMSLVGPRPEVFQKTEQFNEEHRRTLSVQPGITDWASIWNSDEGAVLAGTPDPDEAYERVLKPTKLELQLVYLRTRSLWGDVRIILVTLVRLVRRNWLPTELADYPTLAELRCEVEELIAAGARPAQTETGTTGPMRSVTEGAAQEVGATNDVPG